LKGRVSDKTIDLVKGMGGFGGFSKSGQVFNIEVDGEMQQITASQLAKRWLNDMDVEDAEFIKSKLGEKVTALEAKKARAEALTAESDQWFKGKQEEQAKAVEAQQTQAKEYHSTYEKQTGEWLAKQDALKDRTIPPTATDEEKKDIEQWNKHNAGIRAMVKMAVAPTSIADHVSIVTEAANSLVLSRDNARLKKENESLSQQLSKVQAGLSTTGKGGGSSLAKTKEKTKEDSVAETLRTPVTDSLKEAMEKLRQNQQ